MVSSTGQIAVSSSGLVSGVSSYALTLTATDQGGLTDTAGVNVRVDDDNNTPTFPQTLYVRTVNDGTPAGQGRGSADHRQRP